MEKKGYDSGQALQIIKLGLENGVIRLKGTVGDPDTPWDKAEQRAKDDAAYLVTLYNELMQPSQG